MFEELKKFKNMFGHCNAAKSDSPKGLSTWILRQRKNRKTLDRNKRDMLNELEFDWDPLQNQWNSMFEELKKFKNTFGHCNASKSNSSKELSYWILRQRKNKKNLSRDKYDKLNKLGFMWLKKVSPWMKMYYELQEFHKLSGHCNVPTTYRKNPKLAAWVQKVRDAKKLQTTDQLKLLESIGFVWSVKK